MGWELGSLGAIDANFQGADGEFRVAGLKLSDGLRFTELEFGSDDLVRCEDHKLSSHDFTYLRLSCELRADDFGPSDSKLVSGLDGGVATSLDDLA